MYKRFSYNIRFLFLFVMCLFFSCEKADEYTSSPRENFEFLWKILDERYCFFEYKDIDWDEVHDRYSAYITDTMNQFALFDTLGAMLNELKDGHTNLVSSFNTSRYWKWYEDYPRNFYQAVQENYLGTDYNISGGLKYKRLANGQVGYVYYDSFSSSVGESGLDYMFLHFIDCKGLIFDIRDNGGGTLTNCDIIASRFLDEKTHVGYLQYKTGKEHNDFSEPYAIYIEPAADHIRWLRWVVVLTNRSCYSAANDFVLKMKEMPYVTIMGDKTGGGSGLPFTSELPNGWGVRFSACPMLDKDKQHTEFGIDPDIRLNMDMNDVAAGKDTYIEKAIEYILWKDSEAQKPEENP